MTITQWFSQYVVDFSMITGGFQINLSYLGLGIVTLFFFARLKRAMKRKTT